MIAFKFVQGGNWDSSFKDTDGHWAQSYIEGAFREKLISGYQDGTFRPDAPITRAEAVKILLSATNFDDSAEPAGFSDVKQTDWFARYVNYAVSKNIINGDSGYNTFRPNATITRAEVAKIVALML